MRYIFTGSLLGIIALGVFATTQINNTNPSSTTRASSTATAATDTEPVIDPATIPLDEKIGQLFVVGHWSNTEASTTAAMIKEYELGGVVIMSAPNSLEEIRTWTESWQNASEEPLLVTIDQEGGTVSRLEGPAFSTIAQPDITTTASATAIARERGEELFALGINGNFAPVIDTSVNADSFLYARVFRDPTQVGTLGNAMIDGYTEAGVLATPKHFPGHPDTAADSHETLPILSDMSEAEYRTHTEPFRAVTTNANTHLLMTAHVLVPALDETYPATLSPAVMTDLRERIGYDRVVITDDLVMSALHDQWDEGEAAVLALKAGVDMLLLAAEPDETPAVISTVEQAVINGNLSEERIDEAYLRVMEMKREL